MGNALKLASWACLVFLFSLSLSGASSYTFYVEPTGGNVELGIQQKDISLERIYFNLTGQDSQFVVKVYKVDSNSERIYDYFLVNTTGLKSEPELVVFDIRINKSWLEKNNVDAKTLTFYINDNGWKTLTLIPFSEDAGFLHYRVSSPKLDATFALSGEPVPVTFTVTSQCNRNGLCEPENGEDRDTCPDCVSRAASPMCVPSQKYCFNANYLFVCDQNGTEYRFEECTLGCVDDACIAGAVGPVTGMAVASNPIFILVVAVLLTVVLYLSVLLKRMRKEIRKSEEKKISYEDVKAIVKGKD